MKKSINRIRCFVLFKFQKKSSKPWLLYKTGACRTLLLTATVHRIDGSLIKSLSKFSQFGTIIKI